MANTTATLQVSSNANNGNVLVVNHTGEGGNLAVFQRSGINVARIDGAGQGIFNGRGNSHQSL